MTRNEILNMPAGREMDALVADKVMHVEQVGWRLGYYAGIKNQDYETGIIKELLNGQDHPAWKWVVPQPPLIQSPHGLYPDFQFPRDSALVFDCAWAIVRDWTPYSTDISAAWEVVEKLQGEPQEFYFGIYRTPTIPYKDTGRAHWHCEFGGEFGFADTAPLAICRAALLATLDISP